MGATEEEHLRGLERQAQLDNPDRFIKKLFRRYRSANTTPNQRLISAEQFREVYNAVAFANCRGAILNTHVTFTWRLLGFEEDAAASAALHSGFIKHLRGWYRDKSDHLSRPLAWVYAHERSDATGLHTHFLLFVPDERRAAFDSWLSDRVRRIWGRGTPSMHAVRASKQRHDKDRALWHQWMKFSYLMKTIDPRATLPVFNGSVMEVPLRDLIMFPHEGPGDVGCRLRISIARGVRAPVQKRAGFRSLLDNGITDVRLLFGDEYFRRWRWAMREAELATVSGEGWAREAILAIQEQRNQEASSFASRCAQWLATVRAEDEGFRTFRERQRTQLEALRKVHI